MSGRLVRGWTTRQSLEPLVLKSLIHVFNDMPQIGWIRGDAAASERLIEQSNTILQENASLRAEIAKLRSSSPLQIPDIAGLDESVDIRYRTRRLVGREYRYTDRTITLTWRQLFFSLAGNLEKPKTDIVIAFSFLEAAKEADCEFTPSDMNDTDRIRVKVQFIALGLIKVRVSSTTKGGLAEFLSLTDKGRSTFIEGMVSRKPKIQDGTG